MKVNLSIFNSSPVFAFVCRALFFIAIFLALDWSTGTTLDWLYKKAPHGSNWTKVNWLLEDQFDVVIFGSSRAFRHYIPSIISEETGMRVFNAGQNGQYLRYAYALEQLMLIKHAPQVIVLDVVPNFIVKLPNPKEEDDRLAVLSPYIDNKHVKEMLTRGMFFEELKYCSKTFRYNSKVLTILDNIRVGPGVVDNGFVPLGAIRFHERNPFLTDLLKEVEIDTTKIELLHRFVDAAKSRGILVVAVFSPVVGQLSERSKSIVAEYQEQFNLLNVPFFNFADDSLLCNDYTNFMDYIHLDQIGAERFSRKFSAALLEILRDNQSAQN